MATLRHGMAVALLALAGVAHSGQAYADNGLSQAAKDCPTYGGWILYRMPNGGSGGLAGLYAANLGDCVTFFVQNPDDEFVAVVNSNPRP